MMIFKTFVHGLFGSAPTKVQGGPQVSPISHSIFDGVKTFFIGHHENPRIPLAPVRQPPISRNHAQ